MTRFLFEAPRYLEGTLWSRLEEFESSLWDETPSRSLGNQIPSDPASPTRLTGKRIHAVFWGVLKTFRLLVIYANRNFSTVVSPGTGKRCRITIRQHHMYLPKSCKISSIGKAALIKTALRADWILAHVWYRPKTIYMHTEDRVGNILRIERRRDIVRNSIMEGYLLTYLHTYLFTYLLTYSMEQSPSWEAKTGFQLVKKFPAFYGTRRFITSFTSARHLSLSWASSIQSTPPHPSS